MFEASNQWFIDVALRGWKAHVVRGFGVGRAIHSAPGFSGGLTAGCTCPAEERLRRGSVVLAMLIGGARRVRHVCYLANDPLVERLCGLSRLPSWHTLGRWLRGFDAGGVQALLEVNERLVAEVIDHSGLPRWTWTAQWCLQDFVSRVLAEASTRTAARCRAIIQSRRTKRTRARCSGSATGRATYTTARPRWRFLVSCSNSWVRHSNAGRCWRCAWTGRISTRP